MNENLKEFLSIEKCYYILSKFIGTNTVNPDGNEMDLIKLIISMFDTSKINYEIIEHGNNRGSLIIKLTGKNTDKTVGFVGHLDTVPISNPELWTHQPLSAVREENIVYGRGAADMKGGLTAMVMTALYLTENDIIPPTNVNFYFTADEESDGIGVSSMMRKGCFDEVNELIICEPSCNKLGIAEKGALWLEIKVRGKGCHASMPQLGINAVEKAIDYIAELKEKLCSDDVHELLGENTVSTTMISGGIKTNMIPEFASVSLDIRTNPDFRYTNSEIINIAKSLAEDFMDNEENLKIEISVTNNREPLEADIKSLFIQKLFNVYEDMSKEKGVKGINFYTDASQIIPFDDIPFVIWGPGNTKEAHKRDEKIDLTSIIDMAAFYYTYLLKYSDK